MLHGLLNISYMEMRFQISGADYNISIALKSNAEIKGTKYLSGFDAKILNINRFVSQAIRKISLTRQ